MSRWYSAAVVGVVGLGVVAHQVTGCDASKLANSENLKRWNNSWARPQQGWNTPKANTALETYFKLVDTHVCAHADAKKPTIVVPLCGNSKDLFFLRNKGYSVIGVEGIDKPLKSMEQDSGLNDFVRRGDMDGAARIRWSEADAQHTSEEDGDLTVYQGDLFAMNLTDATADAVYDRASLVAIEPSLREKYAERVDGALKPGGCYLLVVVQHDGSRAGPPFNVSDEDVDALFAKKLGYKVQKMSKRFLEMETKRFEMDAVHEAVYFMTKPGNK